MSKLARWARPTRTREFAGGQLHGTGTLAFAQGDTFHGTFADGAFARGTYTYADGSEVALVAASTASTPFLAESTTHSAPANESAETSESSRTSAMTEAPLSFVLDWFEEPHEPRRAFWNVGLDRIWPAGETRAKCQDVYVEFPTDLSPLRDFPRLRRLTVRASDQGDIDLVGRLQGLEDLHLSLSRDKPLDLAPLEKLQGLKRLWLDCGTSELPDLTGMGDLRVLRLSADTLTRFPLPASRLLQVLDVERCPRLRLDNSFFTRFRGLRDVCLPNKALPEIHGDIFALPYLSYLKIGDIPISDAMLTSLQGTRVECAWPRRRP